LWQGGDRGPGALRIKNRNRSKGWSTHNSDAGLLPLRQFDEAFGLTQQLAEVLEDSRYQPFVDHSLVETLRMRDYGILAD